VALWLGLIASLVHLSASTFLIFLGTAGVLQDADQWSQHSERVVAQISLLTLGSTAGIFASALALWRRSDLGLVKLRISTGAFLTAAVMTIVSVIMGWDYWLEFGSNVAFFCGVDFLRHLFPGLHFPWNAARGVLSEHISLIPATPNAPDPFPKNAHREPASAQKFPRTLAKC